MKRMIFIFAIMYLLSASVWVFADEETGANRPPSFFVICTDRAGVTMEVSSFSYNFVAYDYPTPGWIGKTTYERDNPRMFLPFEYKEAVVAIPFADIDTIRFTDDEPEEGAWKWGKWKPTLSIKLRDRSTLTGKLAKWGEYAERFTGETEFGKFSLPVEKVRQIAFDHERSKKAPRVGPSKDNIKGDLNSEYTISIKTWQGDQVTLLNGCQFLLGDGHKWIELKTEFDVQIGESTNIVSFDKIKSVQFQEKGKPEAQLTTTSGKTIEVSLPLGNSCLGGNLEKFGPARIEMSKVASFEISRSVKP